MNSKTTCAILGIILFVLGALLGYCRTKAHFEAIIATLRPKVEIVTIHDTIAVIEPKIIERRLVDVDTFFVAVHDSVEKHDTIFLPREQAVYADSTYTAYVSGVKPRLDSIFVYPTNTITTKVVTEKVTKNWDFGLEGGIGLLVPFNSTPTFGGYIGYGVRYRFGKRK